MFFQVPQFAILLFVLALFLGIYLVRQRRRRKFALRYASVELVREAQRGRGWRRHIPAAFFLLSSSALVFALMQPAVLVREPSDEAIIMLALDVSASMWANDLYPNRMEAAKNAAQQFVNELPPKMRVGVVSFSETSYLNQAPTTNRDDIQKAIAKLQPRSGTAIGNGLLTSLDALYGGMGGELPLTAHGEYAPAIIVLLTDGENTEGPSPLEIVPQAAEHGIRVYTIGVGTPNATTVQVGSSMLRARLDEETLQEIARVTDAKYYNASSEQDLHDVYENLTTQLVTRFQPQDISFLFVTTAFFFGVLAMMFSIVWSNRLP